MWYRLLKQLGAQRKNDNAAKIQKYIKGTLSRKLCCKRMKEQIIGPNLEYLGKITFKLTENSQILIRYHWKLYLKRKAAKKAKKKASDLAKNTTNKYGQRVGAKKSVKK